MPVDDKKIRLRSVLAGKSTEELEELLALSFSMEDGAETDEAYITTIMEVIREKRKRQIRKRGRRKLTPPGGNSKSTARNETEKKQTLTGWRTPPANSPANPPVHRKRSTQPRSPAGSFDPALPPPL